MQIIDTFYLLTSSIIVVGLSILMYRKIGMDHLESFHVTISGSNIQSFLLAYQISKLNLPNLNMTLIGKFDPDFMRIAESELNNQMPNVASLNSQYIDRKLIEFCGDEPLLKRLIEDTHLQFKIKRSEILFNKGSSTQSEEEFAEELYTIDQQKNTINSIVKYGLSHVTAMALFKDLNDHLKYGIEDNMNQNSMRGILNKIMPSSHRPSVNGLEYLSQVIGLDQKYIRDYVNPLISSHYLHNVNSIATIFKMIPLYCTNHVHDGRTKNLVLHLNERMIAAKILVALKDSKNINIKSMKLLQFQQSKQKVQLSIGSGTANSKVMSTDLLIILQDFEQQNEKQISYYRTIVDGLVSRDEKLEEVYTIHFQNDVILSVTRLCANECKNFRNNAYQVISRTKLQEKDLTMFTQHQILNYRKFWGARSQLPSSVIKFQQTPHIYRVSDTELISDSYELKLIVFKNLANTIRKQALSFRPKINQKQSGEDEGDSN